MSHDTEDEDDVVTMNDLMEYEMRNLAGCDNDDNCCTFPKGYVYRQAIYLCLTCLNISKKSAGVCYPCSVHCHEGHQLLDLYTKRNFRCDCGNGSFPEKFKCKLWEEKDDVNVKNLYNQNFFQIFCVCGSQYQESQENEDMYQCNICEDWFHLTCLTADSKDLTIPKVDTADDSKEFTCKNCIKNNEYLQIYNFLLSSANTFNIKENMSNSCRLMNFRTMLQSQISEIKLTYGVFWPEDWRQYLCQCSDCRHLYEEGHIDFLLNKKDAMSYYYCQASDEGQNQEDIEEVLVGLPHAQAITIAEGIASFKRDLTNFMNSQDPSKVVTSKDIKDFFDNLKKRRLGGGSND